MKASYTISVNKTVELPDFTLEAGEEVRKTGGLPLICYCGWRRWHYIADDRVLICASCGRSHG